MMGQSSADAGPNDQCQVDPGRLTPSEELKCPLGPYLYHVTNFDDCMSAVIAWFWLCLLGKRKSSWRCAPREYYIGVRNGMDIVKDLPDSFARCKYLSNLLLTVTNEK